MEERGIGTGALGIIVAIVVVAVVVPVTAIVLFGGGGGSAMGLSSSAFSEGGSISAKYTADGANVSPPLTISNVPSGAQSLALIVDDQSASGFTHWLFWNIRADTTTIPEGTGGVSGYALAESENKQGTNDFSNIGYGGPDPPEGSTHTYRFKLYALDATLTLEAGASKAELEQAMTGHVVATATLTGTYSR
jgi:hypothetical protein